MNGALSYRDPPTMWSCTSTNMATTPWVIVACGEEGAELRFSPALSPDMSEDGAVPSARMASIRADWSDLTNDGNLLPSHAESWIPSSRRVSAVPSGPSASWDLSAQASERCSMVADS